MHLGFLYSGSECVCTTVAVDKATKGRSGVIVPCLRFCCLACVGGAVNRGTIRKLTILKGPLAMIASSGIAVVLVLHVKNIEKLIEDNLLTQIRNFIKAGL